MTGETNTAVHRSRFVNFSTANITALAFSHKSDVNRKTPSDLRLAVGRGNGDIEIWNPRNRWVQEFVIQGGKDRSIEGLCWCNVSGEPLRLFSIGGSTVVTEWDLSTGLPLKNYDCNAGVIWSIAINQSQSKISLGCDNGTVVIIDVSGGPGSLEYDCVLMRQEARVLSLAWNRDDFVIGGCSDGRIRVWNLQKESEEVRGRLLHTMKVDKAKKESTLVWSVLYLPASNQIVSGDSTGSVKFWNFHYATLNQSFKVHDADVLCLTTDCMGSSIFSAGVDRKIYQFTKSASKANKDNSNKWVVSCNRLLHANDVRAMCSYQSNGADFLVSGGVEKRLVISSLSSFTDGLYMKMPTVVPFSKNLLINRNQRLLVSWYESVVKIWKLGDDLSSDQNYKLVCKLTLKDEQNISTCSMSPDGTVLVVSRPSTTKVFHLQPTDSKLKVTKLDNDLLLKTGTSHVKFIDDSKIIACSTDGELFMLDLEDDEDEKKIEIDLPEIQETKSSSKIRYINNINHLAVEGNLVALSYCCGTIVLANLETKESFVLANLMTFITALSLNLHRNSIIVVTAENKILEFNIGFNQESISGSILSEWSKKNSENLPRQFQSLQDRCVGIFFKDEDFDNVWLWGSNWLARVDLKVDLPANTRKKPKKHNRDGLTITDDSNFLNDGEEDEDNDLEVTESLDVLTSSLNNFRTNSDSKTKTNAQAFFITDKYRPILFTDFISSNELVVVERPPLMTTTQTGAFDLPKIIF
ncbi:hypothetical protein Kpol_1055p2 [Vanderwaltozyma polyspora DSM 70294]|uniref:Uncharacterized protein n=1 Tax=Vanderwaltozyma polyspora (strain ATCC 22028 / DSM 70294 / BCRC 21397 / CBS 2163 / NBRC 10782 / NRRL Y-8283 / UCD 57-17) TaxID=436907 RepID=A7TG76_VANPO|nr:uncharacterized protein Kpol_1055p2 [Vanderwaltozyma polyspora DSM 70294]EDO18646.1 hypothetical protein Kpol_1055p2 [Vanderwaltozyma polyspora DSM 70294]